MKHSTAQHSTAQHSTAQHSTAQHSTAKLKSFFPLFSFFHSCCFSRSFFWVVPSLFLLLFCNNLFALDYVSVSPSMGRSDQDQTFHITLDDPARRIDPDDVAGFDHEILIEFKDSDGNRIPASAFTSYPHRGSSSNYQLPFELIPVNSSTGADGNVYASEWRFTVPASVMATWEARNNTATTGFDIISTIGIAFATENFDLDSEYAHAFTFVDITAPRVSSITRKTPVDEITNADGLTWTITFDEAVQNVDAADFSVTGSTAIITSVTQDSSAEVWDITITGGDLADLNAAVGLFFSSNSLTIQDMAGNALTDVTPIGTNNNIYTLDNTAPRVSSIARKTPLEETTNADSLTWTVTFDEAVEDVDAADFSVSGSTAAANVVQGSNAAVWEITVSGGNLVGYDGDVVLEFAANQNIQDPAGNVLTDIMSTGVNEGYTLDNTAPRVSSIARKTPLEETTNADSLTWTVSFDEAVQNVDPADFSVTGGSTATVTGATRGNTAAVWEITASGGDLADYNGNVGLALAANQNIQDLAGNDLTDTTPTGTNDSYILNNTRPTVSIDNAPGDVTDRSPFPVDIEFSKDVAGFELSDITVTNGAAATLTVKTASSLYSVEITPSGTGDITIEIAADVVQDAAGNGNSAASPVTVSYDATAPRISSVVRKTPAEEITNADMLTWTVSFDEAVQNVDPADFSVSGSTAAVTSATQGGNAAVWDITASGGNFANYNGGIGLALAASHNIQDLVGNALVDPAPSGANEGYTLDNTAPRVTMVRRDLPPNSPTNADTLRWLVIFNESVKDVDAAGLQHHGQHSDSNGKQC